jgi:UDP-galactopyranose mutase
MRFSGLKYLVVGAGLWGCILAERITTVLGERVLVIDRRKHSGGNCHSFVDTYTGIECHAYGTHIFHTAIPRVWKYISRFSAFTSYRHKVFTEYKGRVYPMPIGLATINMFYNLNLRPYEVKDFINKERDTGVPVTSLEGKAVSLIGRPLYEAFIKGYTWKQWNKDPGELPAEIITRLPVRTNYTTDYFDDPWQGLPLNGYAHLFANLLRHDNIELELNTEYRDIAVQIPNSCRVFYSGPLDELFDFALGALEWRSLRFERAVEPYQDVQGTSVLNQADREVPFIRTHEFKHLHPERGPQGNQSLLACEYSQTCTRGSEPYYPVNTPANERLLTLYRERLGDMPNVICGGRLGKFRYLDMDKTIDDALTTFDKLACVYPSKIWRENYESADS